MNVEAILEGLSQEDRLALLERLIKDADETPEEQHLTVEDRIARLEQAVFEGPSPREGRCAAGGPRRWRMRGRSHARGREHSRRRGSWASDCC